MRNRITGRVIIALIAWAAVASNAHADDTASSAAPNAEIRVPYPTTKTVDIAEEQFGVKVADPYRWLEDDVRVSGDVAQWVDQQNGVTNRYLVGVNGRNILAARMKQLFDYERFGLPQKAGRQYFFTKNSGLQNQSVLYGRSGLKGKDRILIDPNGWATDGATALDAWVPSQKGKLLAYSVQDGGSDWRRLTGF